MKLPNGADYGEGQKVFPFTKSKVVTGTNDNIPWNATFEKKL